MAVFIVALNVCLTIMNCLTCCFKKQPPARPPALALPASAPPIPPMAIHILSAGSVKKDPSEFKLNLIEPNLKRDLNSLADSCISALKTWEEEKDPHIADDLRQFCTQMADTVDQKIDLKKEEVRQGSKEADALIKLIHALRQPLHNMGLMLSNIPEPVTQKFFGQADACFKAIKRHIGRLPGSKLPLEPRGELIKLTTLDFSKLWEGVEAQVNYSAKEKNIKLVFSYSHLRHLRGDQGKIDSVLVHFVSNAIKQSNPGSVVEVMIKILQETDLDAVVIFGVKDYGPGVAPENQGKLFKTLSQVGPAPVTSMKSTGIGLSDAKELVDLMTAPRTDCIGVESNSKDEPKMRLFNPEKLGTKGALFWFMLDLRKQAHSPSPAPSIRLKNRNIQILAVEDSMPTQKMVRAHFLRAKCPESNYDCVYNGTDAVAAVKAKQYDVVLLDMTLPDMKGWQIALEIYKIAKPFIIVIAGLQEEDVRKTFAEAGVMGDFIVFKKPVLPPTIINVINKRFPHSSSAQSLAQPDLQARAQPM